jgi:hypothetical protein
MANRSTASGFTTRLAALLIAGLGFYASAAPAGSWTRVPTPTGAPVISGSPADSVIAGSFYDFRPTASDPNGDALTFSINKLPRWARFDTATGRLYGTPTTIDIGRIRDIVISVSDGTTRKSLPKFTLKVFSGSAPSISGSPPTSVKEGQSYAFQPAASDADRQPLSFGIIRKPTWASFDTATGRLSGTPGPGSAGSYANVGISVTDGASTVSLSAFTINVTATQNSAPTIGGAPTTSVQAGQAYAFQPTAADADGDALSFTVVNLPSWASFSSATGRITGAPQAANVGAYPEIVVSVSDGPHVTFLPVFAINVTAAPAPAPPANSPPMISGSPSTTATEGTTYAFQPSASDADGDTLTFSASGLPSWLGVNAGTGRLGGTPPKGSAGTYGGIVVSVSDGKASVSLPAFSITVSAAPNNPPTISGSPTTTATEGTPYAFQPSASDPDGDPLTFSATGLPSWLVVNSGTGRLSGTPPKGSAGTFSGIVVSVSDSKASVSLPAFSITVSAAPNNPPTISGSPTTTATEGTAYAFQPSASDPDGDPLTFSATGLPSWLVVSTSTGRLSGTPPKGSAGSFSGIVVSVSDGKATASLPAFSITVSAPPNNPPTISGTPASSGTTGQAYSFQPTASDPDGQTLAFGIANKPGWASFSATTGRLSGTPAAANVGTNANIVISVSDGTLSATLPAFSITVTAANRPPTISGTPAASVTVGQAYSFQPTATDPDGQTLTFSIANRPAWAAFSSSTGRLSGTPAAADAGTYANIAISVTDGQASAQLPAFSITANQVSTGTATLSWQPPTQNADGSPLTNLAGYRIRYGTTSNALSNSVQIANPGITSAVIESLSPATWYFAVVAYNTVGVESDLSSLAQKTIQ